MDKKNERKRLIKITEYAVTLIRNGVQLYSCEALQHAIPLFVNDPIHANIIMRRYDKFHGDNGELTPKIVRNMAAAYGWSEKEMRIYMLKTFGKEGKV